MGLSISSNVTEVRGVPPKELQQGFIEKSGGVSTPLTPPLDPCLSPDPAKVDIIKDWPEPEDKAAVKSFLQTVQFCAPYMKGRQGKTYADITAPLRSLTSRGKHFKWTEEC